MKAICSGPKTEPIHRFEFNYHMNVVVVGALCRCKCESRVDAISKATCAPHPRMAHMQRSKHGVRLVQWKLRTRPSHANRIESGRRPPKRENLNLCASHLHWYEWHRCRCGVSQIDTKRNAISPALQAAPIVPRRLLPEWLSNCISFSSHFALSKDRHSRHVWRVATGITAFAHEHIVITCFGTQSSSSSSL